MLFDITNTGAGGAGQFLIASSSNDSDALFAGTDGTGNALNLTASNGAKLNNGMLSGSGTGVNLTASGSGTVLNVQNGGSGMTAVLNQSAGSNTNDVLSVATNGTGWGANISSTNTSAAGASKGLRLATAANNQGVALDIANGSLQMGVLVMNSSGTVSFDKPIVLLRFNFIG